MLDTMKLVIGVVLLVVLNFLDAVLTLYGTTVAAVHEANPLIALLISKSPAAFVWVKLAIPLAFGVLCWLNRKRKFTSYALAAGLFVYAVVGFIHSYWLWVVSRG